MKNFIYSSIAFILLSDMFFAQSHSGMALSLDGNGDYADFGNNLQTNFGASDFTIEFWINKTDPRLESVMTKRIVCANESLWSMRAASNIHIEVSQDAGGTNYLMVVAPTTIINSAWHHVAVTRIEDSIAIYFDGNFDAFGISAGTTNIVNSASLFIGNGPCVGVDGTMNFTGQIDEVRIWNIARSNSQIHSTMYDTLGTEYYSTSDSGLIGYWRFDILEDLGIGGGGTDDVRDFSIYGNHCDLVGDATLELSNIWTGIGESDSEVPNSFFVYQNYPNPFNPNTALSFVIGQSSFVKLKIYDVLGNEVATLVNEEKPAGTYEVTWYAGDLPSGLYFYQLRAGDYVAAKKMLLIK